MLKSRLSEVIPPVRTICPLNAGLLSVTLITTMSEAEPLTVRIEALLRLTDVVLNTRLPLPSRMPLLALMVWLLVSVRAVPTSPPLITPLLKFVWLLLNCPSTANCCVSEFMNAALARGRYDDTPMHRQTTMPETAVNFRMDPSPERRKRRTNRRWRPSCFD